MRNVLLSIFLASAAAAPTLAAPDDLASRREQARAERQQAREDRHSRAERTEAVRPERAERTEAVRAERVERSVERRARAPEASARVEAVGRADARDLQAVRETRRQAAETRRATATGPQPQNTGVALDRIEQRRQEVRERIAASRLPRPPVSTVPLPNTQPPAPVAQRPTPAVQWSGNWRDNHRYDWYNHRHRNWSLFHLGFYLDPFGWGYQRYNIGWRMWPSYYGSQYWLNDPWQYRLPYAPPGYRWVRYWDDAVLVDTWSGQVVDVLYNFFW